MSIGKGEATTDKRREEITKRRREIWEMFIVYTLNLVLDGGLHVDVMANEHNPRSTAVFLFHLTSCDFDTFFIFYKSSRHTIASYR